MALEKAKGSIYFEIVIVILVLVLVGSIVYPKKLAEQESSNIEVSRFRMDQLQKSGLQYQKYHGVYTDTLSNIIDFIRTSPEYAHYIDSVVIGGLDSILTTLNKFKEEEGLIRELIPQATDSVMIDSVYKMQNDVKFESRILAGFVEYVHDRMKSLPNMPMDDLISAFLIIDSKKFTIDMEIVKNSTKNGELKAALKGCDAAIAVMSKVANTMELVKQKVPDYKNARLDEFGYCATTGKPFTLVHVDTAVIKYLNIFSPIDSVDIANAESDFIRSTIGGLEIKNHGKIESGEKSWETQ